MGWSPLVKVTLAFGGLACAAGLTPPTSIGQETDTTRAVVQSIDLSGGGDQGLESLTGEDDRPLQITGFGVGDYAYDGRTNENSFIAGKLALALFREIDGQLWFFGQLTTSLSTENAEGDEVPTEIEIDNLIVNFTPRGATNFSLGFGKLDAPIGFERDDEPLNFVATESFNFEYARPAKIVGLIGRWNLTPGLDVSGWLANGWNSQVDPNHGKTAALAVGLRPTGNTSFALAGLYGPEGEQGDTADRYLLNLTYAFQPSRSVVIGGEANYGGDRNVLPGDTDAVWYGALLTLFGRLSTHVGGAVRGEVFRDRDGARTGVAQTLESITVTPIYFVGTGRQGIFANVEHTTFRIPRFQVRAGLRYDHSNEPFFETSDGEGAWRIVYLVQAVVTF